MPFYNLNALNPTDFEHMIQALALKVLGSGVSIFGAGPDGGREATFDGSVNPPLSEESWNGYGVIQAKFKTRVSENHAANLSWLKRELQGEINKFLSKERPLKRPEYYIFVTNLALTAAQNGTYDQLNTEMKKAAKRLKLKGFDIWHYEKICRLLDDAPEIRITYGGIITSGDILKQLQETLLVLGRGVGRADFGEVMTLFLQNEMRDDLYARLGQAGHLHNQRISLSNVFIDVPASIQPLTEPAPGNAPGFIEQIVDEIMVQGQRCLRPSVLSLQSQVEGDISENEEPGTTRVLVTKTKQYRYKVPLRGEEGRYVIVGGPGQGKSTVGQFACQLYRAAILRGRPSTQLTPETRSALAEFAQQCERSNILLPVARRFPFRVVLDRFAAELSRGNVSSLMNFIKSRIESVTERTISLDDLRLWLRESPWLLVLDGLDEVPASSNRTEVMNAIHQFCAELAMGDADVLIIATTRPQGYNSEFGPDVYKHRYLVPLSVREAMEYASRLLAARYSSEPDRQKKIIERLNLASQSKTTARLMRSPLQVTILAALVEVIGQPPQERWKLFSDYFNIVYRREIERDIALSRVLSDNRDEVEVLHRRAGMLLQTRSEEAGGTESSLSRQNLRNLIENIFEEEEFLPQEVERKTNEIYEAALDRLVFLVPLQEDAIGFEVRSLQEFMAAEALMEGSEEQIRLRLEAIAPAPHWRNVFLFAAGKCFSSDRRHLRTEIVALCSAMNTIEVKSLEDEISTISLLGSRLALDLLGDDVARNSPRLRRQLIDTALQIMRLSDETACLRLASLYEDDLAHIYRDKLEVFLAQPTLDLQWGAWVIVRALSNRGIEWATELAKMRWPINPEDALRIISLDSGPISNLWIQTFLVPLIPKLKPNTLGNHRLFTQGRYGRSLVQQENMPAWARAVFKSYELDHDSSTYITSRLYSSEKESSYFELRMRGLNESPFLTSELEALQQIPIGVSDWAIFRAAPAFTRRPCQSTLAIALRTIADDWEHEDFSISEGNRKERSLSGYEIPWPLRACVTICNSAEQLRVEAERVERGDRGDVADWKAAEARWRNGLKRMDFAKISDSNANVPYDSQIGTSGYPLHIAGYSFAPSKGIWIYLYQKYQEASGSKARKIWAEMFLRTLYGLEDEVLEHVQLEDGWRNLIADAETLDIELNWLHHAIRGENLRSEEVDFIDWLGRQERNMIPPSKAWPLASLLIAAYQSQPTRIGILRVLGILMSDDQSISILPNTLSSQSFDMSILEGIYSSEIRKDIEYTLLYCDLVHLLMSNIGDFAEIARRIIELDSQNKDEYVIHAVLRFVGSRENNINPSKATICYDALFLEVWKAARNKGFGQEHAMIDALNQLTIERRSHLTSPQMWQFLSLPNSSIPTLK